LFWAYCSGGCDDISSDVGFTSALQIIKRITAEIGSPNINPQKPLFIKYFSPQIAKCDTVYEKIVSLLNVYWEGASGPGINLSSPIVPVAQSSMQNLYLNELDGKGVPRRMNLKELIENPENNVPVDRIKHNTQAAGQLFRRLFRLRHADKTKSIPFTLPLYKVQETLDQESGVL